MKKVFFALIFSFAGIKFASAANDLKSLHQECLGFINQPQVEVTSSYGKLRYDFEKDASFLQAETNKKYQENNEPVPHSLIPIGLTKVRDGFDFSMTLGRIDVSKGYTCIYPEKINVHLGFYVPTIYILNSLEEGSCLYDLSLRHEKTHMHIYIEALDYFLPTLKKTADGLYDAVGVKIISRGDDADKAAEDLNAQYLDKIKDKVDAWRKEVEKEQMKLDTRENYIIESKLCEDIEAERQKQEDEF